MKLVDQFLMVALSALTCLHLNAQPLITPFEKDNTKTSTYDECIDFYEALDKKYACVKMQTFGETDNGDPLHLVTLSANENHNPSNWKKQDKMVILINNGIHPGEPDGIDASMQLARNIAEKMQKEESGLFDHVVLAIIPVYNIAGCKLRSAFHRVDQNGPEEFGERGNAQNLDLNRDFIKCDSKDAKSFAEIFHYVQADIFIDNHVSDGADYKNVMTLATSQHNKLGGVMGTYLHETFEPALFDKMKLKGVPTIPYVNVWGHDARKGWSQFFDAPRFSSGYATLFNTFAFTVETHMLKPFHERVLATYKMMESISEFASANKEVIHSLRKEMLNSQYHQTKFPLRWEVDTSQFELIDFDGYAYKEKISEVSGLPVMYYDKNEPYHEKVKFYNTYQTKISCDAPVAYLLPKHCWKVADLLRLNGIKMEQVAHDTTLALEVTYISGYKSSETPYEGHHPNSQVKIEREIMQTKVEEGDYYILVNQEAKRFIIEVLEPQGMDSYFSWNFFDAFLIQKEGYSDYAYEAYAADYLKHHPDIRQQLDEKRKQDSSFAHNAADQLDFVYTHSPYTEPRFERYPIFRVTSHQMEDAKLLREHGRSNHSSRHDE